MKRKKGRGKILFVDCYFATLNWRRLEIACCKKRRFEERNKIGQKECDVVERNTIRVDMTIGC